jgi:type III secretion protein J
VIKPARLLIALVFACLLAGCDTALYSNLDERAANSMVAALLQAGIPASRKVQDNGQLSVMVDEQRFAQAMAVLDNAGLPGERFANLGEVFKSNGLVSSPVQERAQMVYALSEELSHSVSQIDGIVSARVHVVLPDNDLLKRVISPSSASVLVRYEPGTPINTLLPQIKTLIANGIAGLAYDGVSVTAVEAHTPAAAVQQPAMASFMGVWMLESDLPRARWLFGGALVLAIGLLGAFAWQGYKRQQPRTYVLKEAE